MTPSEKLRIAWLGGWASSLACWAPDINRLYPGHSHVFFDSLIYLNEPRLWEILAPKSAEKTVIAAWSLGSLLVHERLSRTTLLSQRIHKIISICPVLSFCDTPGGWPRRIVERMKTQLDRDPVVVLNSFFNRLSEGSYLKESQVSAWHNQAAVYARHREPLQAGLDFLMNTNCSLKDLIHHQKKIIFVWSSKDPVSPPAEIIGSTELQQVSVPEGHLPFLTNPQALHWALSI